jgi:septal ring factor EnvC (AmiA/AmiB activator)
MSLTVPYSIQDAHAKSEAEASIENCGDLIEKTRDELEGLEKDLEKAESELEVIRDSLKGLFSSFCLNCDSIDVFARQNGGVPRSDRSETEGARAMDR